MRNKLHTFLTLLLAVTLAAPPAYGLRGAQPRSTAVGLEELPEALQASGAPRAQAHAGLEEPPFGRWVETQADREQVKDIVTDIKTQDYPHAKKKGPREHGTKKALLALMKAGYYVRFYTPGERDYFVFPSSKGTYILWAGGQKVREAKMPWRST